MKKLKKLSIANLSEVELNERRMGQILGGKGGYICQCGCKVGQTDGSTSDNHVALDAENLQPDYCSQPEEPEIPILGNPCGMGPEKQDAICVVQRLCDKCHF